MRSYQMINSIKNIQINKKFKDNYKSLKIKKIFRIIIVYFKIKYSKIFYYKNYQFYLLQQFF